MSTDAERRSTPSGTEPMRPEAETHAPAATAHDEHAREARAGHLVSFAKATEDFADQLRRCAVEYQLGDLAGFQLSRGLAQAASERAMLALAALGIESLDELEADILARLPLAPRRDHESDQVYTLRCEIRALEQRGEHDKARELTMQLLAAARGGG